MLIVYTRMYDLCIGHKISPSCNMSTLFGSSLGEGGEFSRPTKKFVSGGGGGGGNPRNAAVQQEQLLIELSQNTVTIYSIIYYCLQSWTACRRHSNPFSFLSHSHTHKDAQLQLAVNLIISGQALSHEQKVTYQ